MEERVGYNGVQGVNLEFHAINKQKIKKKKKLRGWDKERRGGGVLQSHLLISLLTGKVFEIMLC